MGAATLREVFFYRAEPCLLNLPLGRPHLTPLLSWKWVQQVGFPNFRLPI
jgi:hypothetical protein